MTEIEQYTPRGEVALAAPSAAHALIEWAQSADAAYTLANKLCSTAFVPAQFKGKPVEAAAAMIAGAEVGLSPMASLRAFDVIQGVAAPRALTMRAIAQSQGHEFITEEATPHRVVMRGRRRGSSEWQHVEWTIQRATQLGLTGKDQWKKQPQTMLIARATTELVRLIAADAVLGIGYSAEEVLDEHAPTATVTRLVAPAKRTVQRKAAMPTPEPDEPPLDDPPVDAVEDAELVDDGPSPAQTRKMGALTKGMERDDRIEYTSLAIRRHVGSWKDVTREEAGHVIDALERGVDLDGLRAEVGGMEPEATA